ncbi:MAG: extracellular solute-binding protein [bacterium]
MNRYKKFFNLLNLSLIGIVLATSGFGCKAPSVDVTNAMQPITLEYWRSYDDSDAFADIITDYRKIHPNITINYRKFRPEEYQQALLDAWAEDRGPDIFSVDQNLLRQYVSKIQPMPAQITMAYQEEQGTIKKEIVSVLHTNTTPSLRQIKDSFFDVVYKNSVIDGQVYGLPLALETLVMFYNKDIINRSGISQIPVTWADFQTAVKKISRFDSQGNILQSGTAMGTGSNVDRAFDILSVLMMQNGAIMASADGFPTFANKISANNKDTSPGLQAMQFYIDFASPEKDVYSWNASSTSAGNAFTSGNVGFTFGYNHSLASIRAQSPRLNFGIAPIPQVSPDNSKNYASYWLETVAKKSKHPNEAWDFVLFTVKQEEAKKYLDKTGLPTALKSLVSSQLESEDLYASVSQALTANSWYIGKNYPATVQAIRDMLDQLLKVLPDDFPKVIAIAIQKINQTIR